MTCFNCSSSFIEIIRNDHDNIEQTCVICGRNQIPPSPDNLAPDRAAYIETTLLKINQLRQTARRQLNA